MTLDGRTGQRFAIGSYCASAAEISGDFIGNVLLVGEEPPGGLARNDSKRFFLG